MTGKEFDTYLKELRESIRMWKKDRCDEQMIISLVVKNFCDDAREFTGYQMGEFLDAVFEELSEEETPQSCSSKGSGN